MPNIYYYVVLGVFVLGMNMIPAFMPPTWTILVFFYLSYHLLPLPVIIIGAVATTLGRISLYFFARTHILRFLPKQSQDNMAALGKFFYAKKKITIPAILMYAFLPIPSNQIYIAAGLAKIDIRIIASIFLVGRFISYSSWIATAHIASTSLESIFKNYYSHSNFFIAELVGFGIIYLISRVGWKKILKSVKK